VLASAITHRLKLRQFWGARCDRDEVLTKLKESPLAAAGRRDHGAAVMSIKPSPEPAKRWKPRRARRCCAVADEAVYARRTPPSRRSS